LLTIKRCGASATSEIGAKSLRTSKGRFGNRAGAVAIVIVLISRVWPSGFARATASEPMLPVAPVRFSMMTGCPSSLPSCSLM
jgi:hypothetical protein